MHRGSGVQKDGYVCCSWPQEDGRAFVGMLCSGSRNLQIKNRKAEKCYSCSLVNAIDVLRTKRRQGGNKLLIWPVMSC